MTAAQLIAHCRTTRQGAPEGDIRDPRVLADVLTMLLKDHLGRLESRAQPASDYRQDTRTGKVAPAIPAQTAPDPREDSTACALATLIGFLGDLE